MPFRSEAEQLREQIRRAEAQASELLEERDDLERQAGLRTAPRPARVIGVVVAIIGTSLVGHAAGGVESSRASAARAAREWQDGSELAHASLELDQCEEQGARLRGMYAACVREPFGRPQGAPARREPSHMRVPCTCQAGDPLCACAELR